MAAAAGFGGGFRSAEAAIVNFYPMDATLGGHTDHSEPNLEAPLLSISLGEWISDQIILAAEVLLAP